MALVSENLDIEASLKKDFIVINEDPSGFIRRFDMEYLWDQILSGIQELVKKNKNGSILAISSCAQRIATVFIDREGNLIYGGPNNDTRGIDVDYIIEDEFTEEELYEITGHGPSLLFGLARLLWFQEEEEELYERIDKVLTLDDWLAYKLSGNLYSDYSSAADSQFFDISKGKWSKKIIEAFDFDPDLFPEIIFPGNQVGNLRKELISKLNLKNKSIPIIKGGGDTQANLVGMGAIKENDIGISLGTTAPLHLVIDEPRIDGEGNFWATYHSIKGKYLIEANTGQTGKVYNWFKEGFFKDYPLNADQLIDKYIKEVEPGSDSTFAFLGPQKMNVMNQETIQRGFFVFNSPSMILENLPTLDHFSKALLENIAFGVYENHAALNEMAKAQTKTFCSGGMAKSSEFCQMLANILDTEINVPKYRDAAFIGAAIQSLIGLRIYDDHNTIIEEKLTLEKFEPQEERVSKYKNIYLEWKSLKTKVDDI